LRVTWYQLVHDLYPCFIVSSRFKLSLGLELLSINIFKTKTLRLDETG
jgi:hypothetical protein